MFTLKFYYYCADVSPAWRKIAGIGEMYSKDSQIQRQRNYNVCTQIGHTISLRFLPRRTDINSWVIRPDKVYLEGFELSDRISAMNSKGNPAMFYKCFLGPMADVLMVSML